MKKETEQIPFGRRDFMRSTLMAGAAAALAGRSAHSQSPSPEICVFSKALHWLNYEACSRFAAEIGFDGLDLTVRAQGHVLPENAGRDLPRAAEAAQKADLRIMMITTDINDAANKIQQNVLKTAASLGIKYYRMAWLKYDENLSIEKNLQQFRSRLQALAELNEKYKICGSYQNHVGANLGSPVWDIAQLLNEINSPWLGVQYDIRHAVVEGANSWPLGLKLAVPHINTLVIKDFHWTNVDNKGQARSTPLGEGSVDFAKFFKLLYQAQVKKDTPISQHFEYDLGGAENGASTITVTADVVKNAMKKDLTFLKNLLGSV
jgi:L-ribulose-5-phosphate 3-epimerase